MRIVIQQAYERGVDGALDYLLDNGADDAAQKLLDHAYRFLPDQLARFPRIGRIFLARNPQIPEVQEVWDRARELMGDDIELREYIMGGYLALYAIRGDTLHLLALRHHFQSGYELGEI